MRFNNFSFRVSYEFPIQKSLYTIKFSHSEQGRSISFTKGDRSVEAVSQILSERQGRSIFSYKRDRSSDARILFSTHFSSNFTFQIRGIDLLEEGGSIFKLQNVILEPKMPNFPILPFEDRFGLKRGSITLY